MKVYKVYIKGASGNANSKIRNVKEKNIYLLSGKKPGMKVGQGINAVEFAGVSSQQPHPSNVLSQYVPGSERNFFVSCQLMKY